MLAVAANATDASGIRDVQFKVDGTNIGGPDTAAPYSVSVGQHQRAQRQPQLTALARDSFGNPSTSAGVTVNVQNEDGVPINTLPPKKTPQQPPGETPGGGGGNPTKPANPTGPGNLAPALTRLKLSRAKFRKGKSTTIGFRLSEAARVTLSFERKLRGRRVNGVCEKARKGIRTNCTRYSKLRTVVTLRGKAGANSFSFRGRLSRTKLLAVGSYRITLRATDATGKRSDAVRSSLQLMESAGASQTRAVRAAVLGWL